MRTERSGADRDRDPNIIDFHKARDTARQHRRRTRRTILAAAAAALVLAGLVLFTQLGEILDQKDFWNNFSSSQA